MKINTILTLGIYLLLTSLILIGGCGTPNSSGSNSNQNNNQQTVPQVKETTKEPVDLILQLSDLPENYTLGDKAERLRSEVSSSGLSIGWEKGYYVKYKRIGDTIFDATVIEQYISFYPIENISKAVTTYESNENITYEQMSNPNIGDNSAAYKVADAEGIGGGYIIEFIKKNVYEAMTISGTSTDYELLKELAKKAVAKI